MAAPWWQSAVVYQVYPRSFADASGDGVGDLRGLAHRLDDLAWLGVDAVWLSPIFLSPMADYGYDVADYREVDPLFGTLADLDHLLTELHDRGMRLLLDLVPNHTSSQHLWFLESRSSRDNPRARLVRVARPRRGRRPAEQLDRRLHRQAGLDARRGDRAVLPALLPPRAARPELGEPAGRGGHARRRVLLARPGHRRLSDRRRPPHRQGPRAPRRSSGPRRSARISRSTTTRACIPSCDGCAP